MAPEINLGQPYNGVLIDLFAAGTLLFILIAQHPPFKRAIPTDPFYRLICTNRLDFFWKSHSKNKPPGFFSPAFISLITNMLAFDPTQRLSISDIKAHAWYNGPVASLEEVQSEFAMRKAKIDNAAKIQAEALRKQKMARAQAGAIQSGVAGHEVYRSIEVPEEEEWAPLQRTMEPYLVNIYLYSLSFFYSL